jgi:hypothetical protein
MMFKIWKRVLQRDCNLGNYVHALSSKNYFHVRRNAWLLVGKEEPSPDTTTTTTQMRKNLARSHKRFTNHVPLMTRSYRGYTMHGAETAVDKSSHYIAAAVPGQAKDMLFPLAL